MTKEQQHAAERHAAGLGHSIELRAWVPEDGEWWAPCSCCGGMAQINEDGSYYGPALTDACSHIQGGYARSFRVVPAPKG